MKRVRLAVIGTGGMAKSHARAFQAIPGCDVVAAVDVDRPRVDAFCREHGIPQAFYRTEDLLAQADINAVTIVTPDRVHAPIALLCLAARKHVLCEKPLALGYPEARAMVAAAQKARVVNLVNFSYRSWPALHGAAAAVARGDVGQIRHVEASYLQSWLTSKAWGDWRTGPKWLWRLSKRHGSKGALGDIGVHIVDFTTLVAGPLRSVYCQLKTFPKARRNRIGPYRLDAHDSAAMTVEFRGGALGTIQCTRWASGHINRLYLKVCGTKGAVEIDSERSTEQFRLCTGPDLDPAQWQTVTAPPVPTNYEKFIAAIQHRHALQPNFARGAEIEKIMDACFASDAAGHPVKV